MYCARNLNLLEKLKVEVEECDKPCVNFVGKGFSKCQYFREGDAP